MFISDTVDLWEIRDDYILAAHEDYWLPMLFQGSCIEIYDILRAHLAI